MEIFFRLDDFFFLVWLKFQTLLSTVLGVYLSFSSTKQGLHTSDFRGTSLLSSGVRLLQYTLRFSYLS